MQFELSGTMFICDSGAVFLVISRCAHIFMWDNLIIVENGNIGLDKNDKRFSGLVWTSS